MESYVEILICLPARFSSMLGRRPIAISLLLLSALPFVEAGAIGGLDVPWHPTPRVDGIVGDGEYPPTALSLIWNGTIRCRLYLCQDTRYLYVAAAIIDSNYSAGDGIAICIGAEPPSTERTPRVDDYQITVSRNGAFSTTGLGAFRNATATDSSGWVAEVAIGLSELDVTPGQNRSLGFAIFVKDGGLEVGRWPENADRESPKTWGTLYSSYFWGTVDLVPRSLTLSNQRPNAGEDVTLSFAYTNEGSSPISGARIGFYVDGVHLVTIDDARVIRPSELYIVSAVWRATAGNHTIDVKLDPLNNIRETVEDNNWLSYALSAMFVRLSVRALEGANVTVNGNTTRVGSSKEVVFYVNPGEVEVGAQEVIYSGNTRYVLKGWKMDGGESANSTVSLDMTGDAHVEAIYGLEYRIRMSFLDSKGNNITNPSRILFMAPNGSLITLNGTYDVWLQKGTIKLYNVIWSSVDVLPIVSSYSIFYPGSLTMRCRIYDATVVLRDFLDFPVAGANVTLVLPNMTRVWLLSDADGEAHFTQIPAGKLSGSVSSYGTTYIPEQDLTADAVIQLSLGVSVNTIWFLIAISVGVVTGFLYLLWRRERARKKLPPPPPPTAPGEGDGIFPGPDGKAPYPNAPNGEGEPRRESS